MSAAYSSVSGPARAGESPTGRGAACSSAQGNYAERLSLSLRDGNTLLTGTPAPRHRLLYRRMGMCQEEAGTTGRKGLDAGPAGGELTEYTEMMGKAREIALGRMLQQAAELGADAVLNVRFMTTSVIGSAAELLAYGTAVKLAPSST